MIRAIKNWFFKRWVVKNTGPRCLFLAGLVESDQTDKTFYVAKKQIWIHLRVSGLSPDLIEIAEGTLTVVKGRCVARVEV